MRKKLFFIATTLLQLSCFTSFNSSLMGKDHNGCHNSECFDCDSFICEEPSTICCPPGKRGPRGPRGQSGHNGERGHTGNTGKRGRQGERGRPGQSLKPAFAFRFTPFLEPIEVLQNANIPFTFENTAPVGPISYDSVNNEFIIGTSGYFEISYGISQDTQNVTVGLFLNTTEIPGSRIYVGNSQQLVSGTVITQILKDDVLSLKNTGLAPSFNLSSVIPGSNIAFISIKELKQLP